MDATDLDDFLQTCPYEQSHRVAKSKMQWHIVRCRKNFPGDKSHMKTCPYDSTHIINSMEFEYHVENCKKSASVLSFIQSSEPERPLRVVPLEEIKNVYVPPSSENWDNEPAAQKFDPVAAAKSKSVMIAQVGLSKAKKRLNKNMERERIKLLEESGIMHNPSPKVRKPKNADKPLRPIHKPPMSLSVASELELDQQIDDESPLRPARTKSKAVSVCSDSAYREEILNSSRQLNSTINAASEKGNSTQKLFDKLVDDAQKKNNKTIISQSCSRNGFNIGNDISNTIAADENSQSLSNGNTQSGVSEDDIKEITARMEKLISLEEFVKQERALLLKKVDEIKANASFSSK